MKKSLLSLCIFSALVAPAFAAGRTPASPEQRMEALEARILALEAELQTLKGQAIAATPTPPVAPDRIDSQSEIDALAATPEDTAAAESASVAAPAPGSGDSNANANANAFNPAISIILNGSYAHHSLNPDNYVRSGFPLVGEGGPGAQGLSLGESEIALSSNIDDKFYGQLTLAIGSDDGEDSIGIEEAYIDTTSLPFGFAVRAGRFFSNIGYLNNHHPHTDNFADRPLAYQAFLGNQYGDDGVQLRWVAPTDLFIEVGGELLRGQKYPSGGAAHGGIGARTLFAHAGGDIGSETSWLAGVSMLKSKTEGGEDGFNGDSTLLLADATLKWAPQGNTKDGGITIRGEYFHDDRDGIFMDPSDPAMSSLWNGQRRGAYLEGVYRLSRSWDAGYRYDKLWADGSGPYASDFNPFRHSAELTWRNSEFSLMRLQLSRDQPNQIDTDNVLTLQYQTALGAHGAHKF